MPDNSPQFSHDSAFLLADLANTPLPWWQVATGILGIPAAVIALVYSYVLIQKTRAETAKLKKDLSTQKDELNDVTVFLFKTLINEAELRHLEGLASPDPYPLEKDGFAEQQLGRLRTSRLITVPSGITKLPEHIRDLHEHAALTKAARYYLERRKTLPVEFIVMGSPGWAVLESRLPAFHASQFETYAHHARFGKRRRCQSGRALAGP